MGLLGFLASLYRLDTLDTRFVTSSSVPYQTVVDARRDGDDGKARATGSTITGSPSKWRTPEFYFYYVIFVLAVPYMFWIPYTVSRESDPRWHKYERRLSDGWVPGRKIDVTDAQYSTFRSNIPYMALLLVLHPLLRRAWNSRRPIADKLRGGIDGAAARFEQRVSFDYVFGLVYLVALHGFSALKVLAIFTINYRIATRLPRQYVPVATWVFNVSTLFANELCSGYHFEWMFGLVMPPLKPLGAWLDGWGGIMPRWEILFNITILRLISFNLDYYWSIDKSRTNALEKKQLDPSQLSERDRVSIPADPADYSMRNYIAYAAYAPLYLAGPILTFNDYVSQSKHRAASIETGRTGRYAVRFGLVLLAMELILHFNYVGAISKSNPKWRSYTAAELTMLSFMNLHIIWLKLLIPWRLFRLWALVDGVDPPENMVRCVSNNYSTQLFWRSWHRSYNRWLIRYIYVPMGGASFRTPAAAVRSVVTYLLVFTFVALWHDIQLRLLIWGWLIVFFMLPEWTASYFFPARKWESRPTAYRMLCCVGAVANVIMMIMANLVGFAVGLDGLKTIISGIMRDSYGAIFIITSCACLFVGIQVMFEIRQNEMRNGVNIKC